LSGEKNWKSGVFIRNIEKLKQTRLENSFQRTLAKFASSIPGNWISVSAIPVLASVSANIDIDYIGISQISVKIHRYRPKYRHISAKIPVIGQLSAKMKISVSVSVADMLVLIYRYRYRQKYRLWEYICIGIGIGWTHIGPTLPD
jgi:hypothetical protein